MAQEERIFRHTYSDARQDAFTRLSGDYNPIHCDPLAARRTLAGAQVVHGIHHVLAALEVLLAWHHRGQAQASGIKGLHAQFLKPVLVGDSVDFFLSEVAPHKSKIAGKIDGEIMCQLTFELGQSQPAPPFEFQPVPRQPPRELTFAETQGRHGSIPLGLDLPLARELFPHALTALGSVGLAECLALSRLVGMECPGLHSLFSQATVHWGGQGQTGSLAFSVEHTDERFNRISIDIAGPRLLGRLAVFVRPAPEAQPPMAEVATRVEHGEFSGRVALIVGGSRGLGETTAKIIAAGHGLAIVTYHRGLDEAERLAAEIRAWGGQCELLQLDVLHPPADLPAKLSAWPTLTSLYYFATPKIGVRRGFFSHEMLADFMAYYATAFGRMLDVLAPLAGHKLSVFYPSSVYVTDRARETAEYAIAKEAGEELCRFYNRHSDKIEITVERLPRTRTDQTATLMALPAEESLDVMLPLVRRVEARRI